MVLMRFSLILVIFLINGVVHGQEIGADTASTMRIVGALCRAENQNEIVAQGFYRCYNEAPGKMEFSLCQLKIFGCLLNNSKVIGALCKSFQNSEAGSKNFIKYSGCLQQEFGKASLDLGSAVKTVNVCQAKVVGIN